MYAEWCISDFSSLSAEIPANHRLGQTMQQLRDCRARLGAERSGHVTCARRRQTSLSSRAREKAFLNLRALSGLFFAGRPLLQGLRGFASGCRRGAKACGEREQQRGRRRGKQLARPQQSQRRRQQQRSAASQQRRTPTAAPAAAAPSSGPADEKTIGGVSPPALHACSGDVARRMQQFIESPR